jgi:hypothetical protein
VSRRAVGISKEHEHVPYSKLSWKRDGIIEQGEIPACSVRGGRNPQFGL